MNEEKDYDEPEEPTIQVDEGGPYYFKWEFGYPVKTYVEE